MRLYFRHLGPVSKLLRRRHHATYLATKSCDNIYNVNRSTSSLDWRVNQTMNEKGGEFEIFRFERSVLYRVYRYLSNRALSVTRAAFEIIISGLQSRQSNSLDWRVGRSINKLHWRDTTRSAEQLSRSGAISSDHLQTPSTKYVVLSISFYYVLIE